jgi:hypothetical protein
VGKAFEAGELIESDDVLDREAHVSTGSAVISHALRVGRLRRLSHCR